MTEMERAAADYEASAAQRDPQAVPEATAAAAEHGSQAAGAERGPR